MMDTQIPSTKWIELPIPKAVVEVCQKVQQAGFACYVVGGAVRDALLTINQPNDTTTTDYDLASDATPEKIESIFGRFRTIPTGIKHGTVTVLLPNQVPDKIEMTTFRSEGAYQNARHPGVVHFLTNVSEDLARRDFTINAMAYDPIEKILIDPFDGAKDLSNQILKTVGDPRVRFKEDALRLLRAIRFVSQLGFKLDKDTYAALKENISCLKQISIERIREEWFKLLAAPHVEKGLFFIHSTHLIDEILPSFSNKYDPISSWAGRYISSLKLDGIGRYAALCYLMRDNPESNAKRLKLSNAQQKFLQVLLEQLFNGFPSSSEFLQRLFLQQTTQAVRDAFFEIQIKWAMIHQPKTLSARVELAQKVQEEQKRCPPLFVKDLAIKGDDVQKLLGIQPGPLIGKLMQKMLLLVLKDPSKNTKEHLIEFLKSNRQTEFPIAET